MPLTNEAKIALLNRAVQLESRSFLEYIATTAPPVDIARHPHVAKAFEQIAKEEDEIVEDLVEEIELLGAHADAIGSYNLTFTSYNYIRTAYALKILEEKLTKNLRIFDQILAEAKADRTLETRLMQIRERIGAHHADVAKLRVALASFDAGHGGTTGGAKVPTPVVAAAAPVKPPAPAPGHSAH
jgi:hypothetical protein